MQIHVNSLDFGPFLAGFWGDPGGQKGSPLAPEAAGKNIFQKNVLAVGKPGEIARTHFYLLIFSNFGGRRAESWVRGPGVAPGVGAVVTLAVS